jgi:hypothetical protein
MIEGITVLNQSEIMDDVKWLTVAIICGAFVLGLMF